jgi:hypothetical protein
MLPRRFGQTPSRGLNPEERAADKTVRIRTIRTISPEKGLKRLRQGPRHFNPEWR